MTVTGTFASGTFGIVALSGFFYLAHLRPASAQAIDRGQTVESFFDAIALNDTNTALQMLESNTNLAHCVDNLTKLPLLEAAAAGNLQLVKRLIELGADMNACGDTSRSVGMQDTALHVTIRHNHPAVCRWLLEAGADPKRMAFGFTTPLHLAFTFAEPRDEMAGWLLDFGADPFQEKLFTNDRTTPFELAITRGNGKLVPRMLTEKRWSNRANQFLATHGARVLIAAAQRGELEAVEALLKADTPINGTNAEGFSLMHAFALSAAEAAKAKDFAPERWSRIRTLLEEHGARCDAFAATALGDLDTARRLWSANKNLAAARDPAGETPLHWAVRTDRLPLTSFWLEAGASPATTNFAGQTALHLAAARGLADHVRRLLDAQPPLDVRDTNGWTPLDAAIQARQSETIRQLLKRSPTATPAGRGITTPEHEAAASGNIVALAAPANATNIEARNELGFTPLHLAAKSGQLGAAALLFDKGAAVDARDPDGNTVLHLILLSPTHWIAGTPSAAWIERLKQDPRREKFVRAFTTKSEFTSAKQVAQSVAFFLACGADAGATNHAGKTALQIALEDSTMLFEEDRVALLPLFSQGSGSFNQRDANGDTALHRTVRELLGDSTAALIAAGADVNATNREGRTPLHAAVEQVGGWGDSLPLSLLLAAKPDVNVQDNDGLTPLHLVGLSDDSFRKQTTEALLKAGANPILKDKRGRTPIHLFLSGEWPWSQAGECIALLLAAGADPSPVDGSGQTPLHYLAALGHQSPMFFLRDLSNSLSAPRLDVQARDLQGDTPLHIAARSGTKDVFDWLLKQGASLDATNNVGETPRRLAARNTDPSWQLIVQPRR